MCFEYSSDEDVLKTAWRFVCKCKKKKLSLETELLQASRWRGVAFAVCYQHFHYEALQCFLVVCWSFSTVTLKGGRCMKPAILLLLSIALCVIALKV